MNLRYSEFSTKGKKGHQSATILIKVHLQWIHAWGPVHQVMVYQNTSSNWAQAYMRMLQNCDVYELLASRNLTEKMTLRFLSGSTMYCFTSYLSVRVKLLTKHIEDDYPPNAEETVRVCLLLRVCLPYSKCKVNPSLSDQHAPFQWNPWKSPN